MTERILYGLLGALLGAGIGVSGTWYFMDAVNLPITGGMALLCGLLATWGGDSVIKTLWELLTDVF